MAVSVQLGTITELANVIGKSPTWHTTVVCELKQPCAVENPTLLLSSSVSIAAETAINYAKIQDFGGRCYFCTVSTSPQGYILSLTVDVLESFKSDILSVPCTIARNEAAEQSMIIDQSYVTGARDTIMFKNFTKGYPRAADDGRRFILLTV